MSKKEIDVSRRNLLFGAFRRLRGEVDEGRPVARSSETLPVLGEADAAYAAADFSTAAAKYRDVLKLEPGNLDARRRLGCALYREGRYVQAKVEFERVLRTSREDNEAWLYLGLTLARGGSPAKAATVWKNFKDLRNVALMREINVQAALLEEPQPPTGEQMAEAVEAALAAPRPEPA